MEVLGRKLRISREAFVQDQRDPACQVRQGPGSRSTEEQEAAGIGRGDVLAVIRPCQGRRRRKLLLPDQQQARSGRHTQAQSAG